jgi:hypothetical protein
VGGIMSQSGSYKKTKTVNVFKEDESLVDKSKKLEELFKSVAYRAREKERQEIIKTLEDFMAPLAETKDESIALFFNGIYEAIELIKNKDKFN